MTRTPIQTLVFCDQGNTCSPADIPAMAGLSHTVCSQDLLDYTIRNMGFVLTTHSALGSEIKLRPGTVSEATMAALLCWLHNTEHCRIVLSSINPAQNAFVWEHQLHTSRAEVSLQLARMVCQAQDDQSYRFILQNLSFDSAALGRSLHALHKDWHAGHLRKRDAVIRAADELFDGRYTLVRIRDVDDLVIEQTGSGYAAYKKGYVAQSRGTRLEDEPDWYYGSWVAAAQKKLAQSGKPAAGNVDAIIRVAPHRYNRFRYRRIMLPIEEDANNRFILSASLPDTSISLRNTVA